MARRNRGGPKRVDERENHNALPPSIPRINGGERPNNDLGQQKLRTTSAERHALAMGSAAALRRMKYRVPEGTDPEAADLAGLARERIVEVMMGRVHSRRASAVFKSAERLIDEVCGRLTDKIEAKGELSFVKLLAAAGKDQDE